jgi:hypothetical protein
VREKEDVNTANVRSASEKDVRLENAVRQQRSEMSQPEHMTGGLISFLDRFNDSVLKLITWIERSVESDQVEVNQ